jgi:hypothetical protein
VRVGTRKYKRTVYTPHHTCICTRTPHTLHHAYRQRSLSEDTRTLSSAAVRLTVGTCAVVRLATFAGLAFAFAFTFAFAAVEGDGAEEEEEEEEEDAIAGEGVFLEDFFC